MPFRWRFGSVTERNGRMMSCKKPSAGWRQRSRRPNEWSPGSIVLLGTWRRPSAWQTVGGDRARGTRRRARPFDDPLERLIADDVLASLLRLDDSFREVVTARIWGGLT